MAAVCLTGDELTVLARRLGAARFPGVRDSAYDVLDEGLHQVLDERFLGCLWARELLEVRQDGTQDGLLWPGEPLASLVEAVASHEMYVAVEELLPDESNPGPGSGLRTLTQTNAFMIGAGAVVLHRIAEPLHLLELAADVSVESELAKLLDPSPGAGRPGRRCHRGRKSGLATIVADAPSPRVTVLTRSDHRDDARAHGFLAIIDSGPGELWLVVEDDRYDDLRADPAQLLDCAVVAHPASDADITAAIRCFLR